jgi:hypothetical protein
MLIRFRAQRCTHECHARPVCCCVKGMHDVVCCNLHTALASIQHGLLLGRTLMILYTPIAPCLACWCHENNLHCRHHPSRYVPTLTVAFPSLQCLCDAYLQGKLELLGFWASTCVCGPAYWPNTGHSCHGQLLFCIMYRSLPVMCRNQSTISPCISSRMPGAAFVASLTSQKLSQMIARTKFKSKVNTSNIKVQKKTAPTVRSGSVSFRSEFPGAVSPASRSQPVCLASSVKTAVMLHSHCRQALGDSKPNLVQACTTSIFPSESFQMQTRHEMIRTHQHMKASIQCPENRRELLHHSSKDNVAHQCIHHHDTCKHDQKVSQIFCCQTQGQCDDTKSWLESKQDCKSSNEIQDVQALASKVKGCI